MSKEAAAIPGT